MNSISKSQKFSQEENSRQFQKNNEDKITNLPSCLKAKILSCLPTKDAVKTSILSREWKRSWTFVSNLDFDDSDHTYTMLLEENFVHFVNRVMLLRERSSLLRFCVRSSKRQRYDGSRVNTRVAAILPCHAQELVVSVLLNHHTFLISDIFTCKTLTVLKLDVDGNVNLPTSVDLPHLKTLHLANLEFLDDLSIRNLLSSCLVLEELDLRWCLGKYARVVKVIAPALINFTFEDVPYDVDESYEDYRYEIVLNTPDLKFLNLNEYGANGYVVKNVNHVKKVVVTAGAPYESVDDNYTESIEIRSRALIDLLNGISQFQSLVLSYASMEVCNLRPPCFKMLNILVSEAWEFDNLAILWHPLFSGRWLLEFFQLDFPGG